jgi:hypothetical protein
MSRINWKIVWEDVKFTGAQLITQVAISAILKVNTKKDDFLAHELHKVAGGYMRRPTEGWRAPDHWTCWKQVEDKR